jgi:hypothetical protein
MHSNRHLGIRYKANLIMDLMWTPFDTRFSKILGRLSKHRIMFEDGLDEVYKQEMLWHYDAVQTEIQNNATRRQNELKRIREIETKEMGKSHHNLFRQMIE